MFTGWPKPIELLPTSGGNFSFSLRQNQNMNCEQGPNKAISSEPIEQLKKEMQKNGGKIDFTEAIKRTNEADKRLKESGRTLILHRRQ